MTIIFNIFNSIDSKELMTITIPWDYKKASNGFYSGLWKYCKPHFASIQKLDKRFLRMNIKITKNKSDRFEINFPSGLKLNSPFDLNEKDFKIIGLHLEALSLSID